MAERSLRCSRKGRRVLSAQYDGNEDGVHHLRYVQSRDDNADGILEYSSVMGAYLISASYLAQDVPGEAYLSTGDLFWLPAGGKIGCN